MHGVLHNFDHVSHSENCHRAGHSGRRWHYNCPYKPKNPYTISTRVQK